MSNRKQFEMPVKQPLTFGGVPRSEGGTVTGTPGTALYSDAIYVGDADTVSVAYQVSNGSGTTHALVQYEVSFNFDPRIETGSEGSPVASWVDLTTITADNTTNDTDIPAALSPILAPYIRIKFSGAGSNGAFNRLRGVLFRQ